MKKRILILILFLCVDLVFTESYDFENQTYRYCVFYSDFSNPGFKFSFSNSEFRMDIPELDESLIEEGFYIHEEKKDNYQIVTDNNFTYLKAFGKKYLVLYYEAVLCALVDCDDYTTYFGINEKSKYVNIPENPKRLRDWWIGIYDPDHYETKFSSILKEDSIIYNNNNKYSWQLKYPWSEGKKGSGIDEWIEKEVYKKTNSIVLLNGYVDPNHPDYYLKNERINEIEILANNNVYYYALKDIPQLQIIELPEYVDGKIRIKIKSVYKGSKYTDTCLSYFLFLNERNITD